MKVQGRLVLCISVIREFRDVCGGEGCLASPDGSSHF